MWVTFVLRKWSTKSKKQLKIKWMKGTTMIVAIVLYGFKLLHLNCIISTKIPFKLHNLYKNSSCYIISQIMITAFSLHKIMVNVLLIMINLSFHRN